MSIKSIRIGAIAFCVGALFSNGASAVPLLCKDTAVNHMYLDTTQATSCLASGSGNINGNTRTDDFLRVDGASATWTGIGSALFTQSGTKGTFSLASSLWNEWDSIAIGFKFGTGNKPDSWFVYLLNPQVSSGNWQFVNVFNRGGGLSHIQLYGSKSLNVPEPATFALLGMGVMGAALVRRRKTRTVKTHRADG